MMPSSSSRPSRAARVATVVALGSLLGCDPGVATQVLVTVDADEASRARATSVRITVIPPDGEPIERVEPLVGSDARLSLPFTQPLHPKDDDASRRFHIVVELLDEAGPFARSVAIGGYTEGERREVRLLFTEGCHGVLACAETQTCFDGACAPACVEPHVNAPTGPSVPTLCATHQRPLTVPGDRVRADLIDFPLLVSISEDPDLAATARSDGSDIGFVASDGAILAHELAHYDASTGALIAWVRLPILRAGADTRFYLTFGDAPSTDRPEETFLRYALVVHFDEERDFVTDSSPSMLASRPTTATPDPAGAVHRSFSFDGDGDVVSFDVPLDIANFGPTESFGVSAWIRRSRLEEFRPVVYRGARSGSPGFSLQSERPASTVSALVGSDPVARAGGAPVDVGEWRHVAFVADRETNELRFFLDGARSGLVGDLTGADSVSVLDRIHIGGTGGCCTLSGWIDEVRIAAFAFSDEWVRVMYESQHSPESFVEVGPVERR